MKNFSGKYSLVIEGNDLDAKTAQRLKPGDGLTLKRIDDRLDTYEILVCTQSGREIDMLGYGQSLGLAPFLDDGSLSVKSSSVTAVEVKPGKTRAKDKTVLRFESEFEYDEDLLVPKSSNSGEAFFVPTDNFALAAAVFSAMNGYDDFVRKIQNGCYDVYMLLDRNAALMYGLNLEDDGEYVFCGRVYAASGPHNWDVKAYICASDEEASGDLNEAEIGPEEKAVFLTLVNHRRIFDGEPPFELDAL